MTIECSISLILYDYLMCRFDIKWIRNEMLRTYGNINEAFDLTEKEREYLKALHKRSKLKGQLTKQPSLKDYRVLVKAYGE